jgi:galactokinase
MNAAIERLIEAGMSAEQAAAKQILLQKCIEILGTDEISSAVFAPGRIEFLGKHTDYCGGRSLLCTVNRGLIVAATAQHRTSIRITDTSSGETVEFFPTPDLQPRNEHWSNYPMTVVRRLAQNFGSLRGANIAIASDLPRAAGLSSSSALVVAIFLILSRLNQLPSHPAYASNLHTQEDLAGYLGCVENGQNFKNLLGDLGVGTFGGSQDHTAILCSKPAALVQYRFAPVVAEDSVTFPPDYTLAIAVSGVVAEKTGSAREKYNQVSGRATEILRRWNAATSRADLTLAAALESSPDASTRMFQLLCGVDQMVAAAAKLRDTPDRFDKLESECLLLTLRLQQFIVESRTIVGEGRQAIADGNLSGLGDMVDTSQGCAEQMLFNQVPETIFLAAEARKLGAIAASAFGAGFGGSVWAMIPLAITDKFLNEWRNVYTRQFPQHSDDCQFFTSRPCIPAMTFQI